MQTIQIAAQPRTEFGKTSSKKIRKEGMFPAIIYGGDSNTAIKLTPKSVKDLVYSPDFKLVEIDIDGKKERCILKEITFHPISDEIVHIDFLRAIDGTPIKVELPVAYTGKSPGVKAGGKLISTLRKIKVKALPEQLTDRLYVDISKLGLGDAVRVRDIDLVDGVEIMSPGATPVARVEIPRALRSANAEEAKAAAAAAAE